MYEIPQVLEGEKDNLREIAKLARNVIRAHWITVPADDADRNTVVRRTFFAVQEGQSERVWCLEEPSDKSISVYSSRLFGRTLPAKTHIMFNVRCDEVTTYFAYDLVDCTMLLLALRQRFVLDLIADA